MQPFTYSRAGDEHDAVRAVAGEPGAAFLAGGTSLIDLMKLDVEAPDRLVDVSDLPLADVAEVRGGAVRIGATVRNSDLAHHPLIRQRYPLLSEAILAGASAQLRNMATTGGNLLQRTRCYYYRDTSAPCNKRNPGAGCSAIGGYNRIHAVLGTNEHCISANPSDMNVALAALDPVIVTRGPDGDRRIPFSEFYLLPGDRPDIETVLKHAELITAVELPDLAYARRSHYLKVRDRASYAFALASAAVALDVSGGVIRAARVALGGVGYRPWRAPEAEQALVGKPATDDSFRDAAEAALAGAHGYRYNAFKIDLAKRTLVRTLQTVNAMET